MDEAGFKVEAAEKRYSQSHLILVDVTEFGGCKAVARYLEKANILCSDDFGQLDQQIRIGTAEAARRGMKEADMKYIAGLFKRILIDKEVPSAVSEDVIRFSRKFKKLEYAL